MTTLRIPTGCLGQLGDLTRVCERDRVDHVVVAFSRSQPEDLIKALRPIQGQVAITVVPRLFDVLPSTANVHDLGSGLTGISVAPVTFGWGSRVAKRTIDLVGAVTALLLLSPLLLVLALFIKATSKGPVIFRQIRVGKNNQAFYLLKFRSMRIEDSAPHPATGESATGPFPKLKDDPRVTSVGRILRRISLDELPQLWNVVRGEMSPRGPPPLRPCRRRMDHRLGTATVFGAPRDHRSVAGIRTEQLDIRGDVPTRQLVRQLLVCRSRHPASAAHPAGGCGRIWCLLILALVGELVGLATG